MSATDDVVLAELAAQHGVAVEYADWRGGPVTVEASTVVAVLAALGVDAGTPDSAAAALRESRLATWREVVPPTTVQRLGVGAVVRAHCRHGDPVRLLIECEDGTERADVDQLMVWVDPVEVDGVLTGEATFRLPMDLPMGWHRLLVEAGERRAAGTLVVVPDRLAAPPALGDRLAGWSVQLYAARSSRSWGIGDLGDLRWLASWAAAEHGAGALLCSPVHAPSPGSPQEPSPYYPSSRRFVNPLLLRVEDLPEYRAAPPEVRQRVDAFRVPPDSARLDRDAVWAAKRAALGELWVRVRPDPEIRRDLAVFAEREGQPLRDWGVFCALAERHGAPWQRWDARLHDPRGPAVAQAAADAHHLVDFHCWVQWRLDQQLAGAQQAAVDAGMPIGVIHDLAVGVDPGGFDAWALADVLGAGVTVGAPPDAFNQQGQDWQQPPWRMDRLAGRGFAPYADMVRALARHAGGLRVDHALGLFRSWWVPAGRPPSAGTFVRNDTEALLGILCLEAHRAGALLIGEDLGTVEPRVRDTLAARGVQGTSVLWFEKGRQGEPLPPQDWRPNTLGTVTTHDLPTAAGWLAGEHVRLRARLGLLDRPEAEEWSDFEAERAAVLGLLRAQGLPTDPGSVVTALHALLGRTPCPLVLAALADAVGDLRQPNQPGTTDAYPNWRLPLAGPEGEPVLLDALVGDRTATRLIRALRTGSVPPD